MRRIWKDCRSFAFFCICLALLLTAGCQEDVRQPAPRAVAGVIDLRDYDMQRAGPARLDGEWAFFWERLNSDLETDGEKTSTAVSPEAPIEFMPVPSDWVGSRSPSRSGTGYATYRLRILLPPKNASGLAFKIKDASSAYKIFLNGRLILSCGQVGRDAAGYRPHYQSLISESHLLTGETEISIEVANFDHVRGGLWKSVRIGPRSVLLQDQLRKTWLSIFLAGVTLIIAMYNFALYLIRKKDHSPLLLGFLCVAFLIRLMVTGEKPLIQLWPDFDWYLMVKMAYLSMYIATSVAFQYAYVLYPDEVGIYKRWLAQAALAILGLIVLVSPPIIFTGTLALYHMLVGAVCAVWVPYLLIQWIRNRRESAGIGLGGILFLSGTVLHDVFQAQFWINTGVDLNPFGLLAVAFTQSLIAARNSFRNFEESKRLARRLKGVNSRLLSLDRLKDEFLANTSHELRTPLHGIIGIADSLAQGVEGPLPERTRHQLELITGSARRLSHLVNDILDFSRLKNKDLTLDFAALDFFALVELQIELNQPLIGDREIILENRIPRDFPALRGDENRIAQVLQNLIGNAIRHGGEGCVIVSSMVDRPGFAEISVTDTGPGIAPEMQAAIFEPFEQAQGGLSRERGGGLGLSISRSLVELHGGELSLESQPGQGARFYFTLPLAAGPLEEPETMQGLANLDGLGATQTMESMAVAAAGVSETGNAALQPGPESWLQESSDAVASARILVVDDEMVNLQVIKNYLQIEGHTPVLAESGPEALRTLSALREDGSHSFDCAVVDVMMPEMSGLELSREIRKHYGSLELPILIATARTQTTDLMAALNAGANDYLTKPFGREALLFRVNNLVALRQSHAESGRQKQEKSEAVRRVRERINANLHDHLGAHMTDLKLMSAELLDHPGVDPSFSKRLNQTVLHAITMLRSEMLHIEDLENLSKNFLEATRMILLRRYLNAGREFHFDEAPGVDKIVQENFSEAALTALYAAFTELTTNDIKYGQDATRWRISHAGQQLHVELRNRTNYDMEEHGVGRGTQNLTRRVGELGGTIRFDLKDGVIQIFIQVPLPVSSRNPEGL